MCATCLGTSVMAEDTLPDNIQDILGQPLPAKAKTWDHYSDNGDTFYDKKTENKDEVKKAAAKILGQKNISMFSDNRTLITVQDDAALTKSIHSKHVYKKLPEDIASQLDSDVTFSRLLVSFKNKEGGQTVLSIDNSKVKDLKTLDAFFKEGLEKVDIVLSDHDLVTLKLVVQTEGETKSGLKRISSKSIVLSKAKDNSLIVVETLSLKADVKKSEKREKELSTKKNISDMKKSSFWKDPTIK